MEPNIETYFKRISCEKLDQPIDSKNKNLHGQVVDRDLVRVANSMVKWEKQVASALSLSAQNIECIKQENRDDYGGQKIAALKMWKKGQNGTESGPTPRALIEAFYLEKLYDYCDVVCEVLTDAPTPNGSTSGDLTFSMSMNREQLQQWLLQQLGKDCAQEIKKLHDEYIDGALFLTLGKDQLEKWLRYGIIQKLWIIVQEVCLRPYWCSYSETTPSQTGMTDAEHGDNIYPACTPRGSSLWGKPKLLVSFVDSSLLKKWGLNQDKILAWARKWEYKPEEQNYIPRFELANQSKMTDVLIQLNENGTNLSVCGATNEAGKGKPTMWLDLTRFKNLSKEENDHNQEHIVVHEFGHVLSLGHEHQRSDFWKDIGDNIEKDKIKSDKHVGGRLKDWIEDKDHDVKTIPHTEYDRDSVMHYWFKKEWLKNGYCDLEKINTDHVAGRLDVKQVNALYGVHKRSGELAIMPSTRDLSFLNDYYEKRNSICGGPEPRPPQDTGTGKKKEVSHYFLDQIVWKTSPTDKKNKVKIYEESAIKWETIATKLCLGPKTRIIGKNKPSDVIGCVMEVFLEWLLNANGLPQHDKYPKSWKGLIQLLKDSDLGEVANNVEAAIEAPYSNINGTL